jgi:methylated-DNA-protein-cysteine methyltransferase-like protein
MTERFVSPPNLHAFNALVWEVARQIPPGRVATYGQIAGLIPPPGGMDPKSYLAFGPRWVGGAMAACPADIPWQRVINAQGKISLRPGAEQQRELLEAEGVTFDDRSRVDLKKYRWAGPDEAWCRANGLVPPAPAANQGSLF